MEKVPVPKEVHSAIKYFKNEQGNSIASIYDRIVKVDHIIAQTSEEYKAFYNLKRWIINNSISHSRIMEALVRGTEVEITTEEHVKGRYQRANQYAEVYGIAYQRGMKFVLNAYNIKIEGVNA